MCVACEPAVALTHCWDTRATHARVAETSTETCDKIGGRHDPPYRLHFSLGNLGASRLTYNLPSNCAI